MKKIIQPDNNFCSASEKNFSTISKGRMKGSDFRPTFKAHEMAQYHLKEDIFVTQLLEFISGQN